MGVPAVKRRNRRSRFAFVRPVFIAVLLLALPGYWIVHSMRSRAAKPAAPAGPVIAMQKVDAAQEAAHVRAREAEMAKPSVPAAVSKPDLELISSEAAIDATGFIKISGAVRNNAGADYGGAVIAFDIFNAQRQNVGVARSRIGAIPAGGTAKFQAQAIAPNPRTFRLAQLEGR